MKTIGAVFLTKKLTTKAGHEYYSGKTEGSEEFNMMAFVKESKAGNKYLSLVRTDLDDEGQGAKREAKTTENPIQRELPKEADNSESIIDPNDLPF